jgi:hypothetical protein
MGEHGLCKPEVGGSIPLCSTIILKFNRKADLEQAKKLILSPLSFFSDPHRGDYMQHSLFPAGVQAAVFNRT